LWAVGEREGQLQGGLRSLRVPPAPLPVPYFHVVFTLPNILGALVRANRCRLYSSPDATPVRITDDPAAPAYRIVDPDSTHPFRQKELIAEVRSRLPDGIGFNSFDVVSVRHVHNIDDAREFSYKPKFGSRQYSQAFVDWLVAQVSTEAQFFERARTKHREGDVQ
jgi:hypothetical protein